MILYARWIGTDGGAYVGKALAVQTTDGKRWGLADSSFTKEADLQKILSWGRENGRLKVWDATERKALG